MSSSSSSKSSSTPRGGVSTTQTPANNIGGGSGLGDSGIAKGGGGAAAAFRGQGEKPDAPNTRETAHLSNMDFSSLEKQKAEEEAHYRSRQIQSEEATRASAQGQNASFMSKKPGHE